MIYKKFKFQFNTIAFKLNALLILTIIPVVSLLIMSIFQSRAILIEQVINSHTNTLSSYMIQIENQLDKIRGYNINNALYETDTQISAFSAEPTDAQYAKIRVMNSLKNQLLSYYLLDGLFVSFTDMEGNQNFINTSSNSISFDNRHRIEDYVKELTGSHSFKNDMHSYTFDEHNWTLHRINDRDYLIQITFSPDGIVTGAYIDMNLLINHFSSIDPNLQLFYMPSGETPPAAKDTIGVSVPCSQAPFSLAETFSRNALVHTLPFMQKYTILVAVILVLLPFLTGYLVHHIVIAPLRRLNAAMKQVESGDLDYRIPPVPISSEIALVNRTFNTMLEQVQNLKISIYEQTIKAQRSQLRNLQLQIRPHFLINTLNMVYNLIECGKNTLAGKLILYSADYFRYMVKVDDDFVPLNEELKHIQVYMDIQAIRYENHFTYDMNIDSLIEDMLIPPMLIQCFVENSMKYAINPEKIIHMQITVQSFELDYAPFAKIIIRDTGNGYPASYLPLLNAGQKITIDGESHIGIRNVLQRLKFLFADKVSWQFYNENGAVCEITLPATFDEEGEENER